MKRLKVKQFKGNKVVCHIPNWFNPMDIGSLRTRFKAKDLQGRYICDYWMVGYHICNDELVLESDCNFLSNITIDLKEEKKVKQDRTEKFTDSQALGNDLTKKVHDGIMTYLSYLERTTGEKVELTVSNLTNYVSNL